LTTQFRILDQKPVSQQVYEELRGRIIGRHLRPGERLNEVRIAQDMGISRAPVREAVQRLRQEGLIAAKPRHGSIVAEITGADVTHLYRVRCALEELAVALLFERGFPPRLEALEDAVAAMSKACQDNDLAQVVEQDVRFHGALCDLAGNPLLTQIYGTISAQFRIAAIQDDARGYPLTQIAIDHAELLEVLRRGDVRATTSKLRDHILSTLPNLVARLGAQAPGAAP